MNLKIIDKVKKSFCKHKKTITGIVIAVIALLSVYSFMLPFSDGFYTAPLRMKILGIGSTICGIVFFIIVIITTLKNAKKDKKYYYDILCASPLMLLEIVNVFMIFDCGFLGFKAIIVGISLISVLLIEIFISIRALFHNSFGKELSPVLLLTLAVTSCLFSLANISSGNLEYAKIFAKICFGCAYLVAIALYTNKLIYTPRNPDKPINSIICLIFWGAFITITFPFYIQRCGLTGENFNTFVSVYAAVIGGALTLVGVAWTIKDGNNKRKEDLERIEMERKEEERKKNIPYLMLANDSTTPNTARITETNNLNFSKPTDVSKIKNGTYYVIKIDPFNIKNVSRSNAILKGIFLDEVYHKFAYDILIEKDGLCQIQVGINHWFAFPKKISSVRLLITDTLYNEYTVECEMYKRQDDKPQKDIAPNGIEYTVCSYVYVAETLLLPDYKMEDKLDE